MKACIKQCEHLKLIKHILEIIAQNMCIMANNGHINIVSFYLASAPKLKH